MSNWYAFQSINTGLIVSYSSDDASGFVLTQAGLRALGPYPSLAVAQSINQPIMETQQQQVIQQLLSKSASQWTLADIATWLQNR